ncbi:hypothetical protein M3O96_08700 [Aquiflexum sp. TKW24L]|uniref:hypothetical protein n=1 Tax=Aquiflexum sp. TKW24L TaxID=2942212 RepID=UPI0020BF83F3|nr:hypothetical protein [Aquiflexum sp. TKW24L]MCL6259164.1 hypothetical protein [Aquiflexum sp. TKW24L]
MKKFNLMIGLLALLTATVLFSCDKEEEAPAQNARINFSASYNSSAGLSSGRLLNTVQITSFLVNIEEVELEYDDNDPLFAPGVIASDVELDGPFEVQLFRDGSGLTETLANVALPVAAYDEIEFKIRENEDPNSEMFDKSVVINGFIGELPFVFWTDENDEVEIEFENSDNVVLTPSELSVILVEFDLSKLFDPENGGVDLALALDGNGDGIIEIYEGSPDGNTDLAKQIWEKFEQAIEAFEEKFDD